MILLYIYINLYILILLTNFQKNKKLTKIHILKYSQKKYFKDENIVSDILVSQFHEKVIKNILYSLNFLLK